MASPEEQPPLTATEGTEADPNTPKSAAPRWRRFFGASKEESANENQTYRSKATLGILSDKQTDEVPGE